MQEKETSSRFAMRLPANQGIMPVPMPTILATIKETDGGCWPRRVGSMLFALERDNVVDWLGKACQRVWVARINVIEAREFHQ